MRETSSRWVLTLNQHLPEDVAVRSAELVPPGFSPRFASKKKRYRYDLLFDKVRDPLLCNRSWRIGYDMDMARMEREAQAIVGTHDFAAFRSAGDELHLRSRLLPSARKSFLRVSRRSGLTRGSGGPIWNLS